LILLAVLAVDVAKPGSLTDVANKCIAKSITPDSPTGAGQTSPPILEFSVVGSLSWFLLLCLVIQYYQRSIHVDRQYKYIGDVEEKLCTLMGGDYVTREGKAYLSKTGIHSGDSEDERPMYLQAVGPLYLYVFPGLLLVFVAVKFHYENWCPHGVTNWFNLIVRIAIGLAILFYNALYLLWVIRRK
jgi:hypothetical protein